MRSWVERAYWWWMFRTARPQYVGSLRFIYISAEGDRPAEVIRTVLLEALDRIAVAQGGFGELVGSHLRFVAAIKSPRAWIATITRGYVSSFPDIEVLNPQYLACRLVWAATLVRLSHDRFALHESRNLEAIRKAAREAQLRFVKQFPEAEKWVDYLERHPSGI